MTKQQLEAAVGTERETSAKLDWMLQCYADLEKKYYRRGFDLRALRGALEEIANRPVVERNPDGDDQAAHTMQLIAREALADAE